MLFLSTFCLTTTRAYYYIRPDKSPILVGLLICSKSQFPRILRVFSSITGKTQFYLFYQRNIHKNLSISLKICKKSHIWHSWRHVQSFFFEQLLKAGEHFFWRLFSDILPIYARLEEGNMPNMAGKYFFLGVLAINFLKIDCIFSGSLAKKRCWKVNVYKI